MGTKITYRECCGTPANPELATAHANGCPVAAERAALNLMKLTEGATVPVDTNNPASPIGCACKREYIAANAGPYDTYFPGIVRHGGWRVAEYNRECFRHGYIFTSNLAADLRYGD